MLIEYCIIITLFFTASHFLMRNLEFAVAVLLSSLILNIELPFSFMGVALNIQRLVTIWIMALYFFHVLLIRRELPKITALQSKITVALLLIIFIDIVHDLNGYGGVAFQLSLNVLLFNLIVFMFRSLDYKQHHRLFFILIPMSIVCVCVYFLRDFNFGSIAPLGNSNFYTGYRLRSDDTRNILNVWAGGLSLLVPFLIIPLLSFFSKTKEVLVATISLMLLLSTIAATFSRSAILMVVAVGVITGILWFKYYNVHDRTPLSFMPIKRMRNVFAVIIIINVALMAASGFVGNLERLWHLRIQATQGGGDESVQWRLEALVRTLSVFSEAPLLGQGKLAREKLGGAFENTYAYTLAHWGGVGLIAFLSIIMSAGKAAFLSLRRQRDINSLVGMTLILAYAILGVTNEYIAFPVGMFALAFVVTLKSQCKRSVRNVNRMYPIHISGKVCNPCR